MPSWKEFRENENKNKAIFRRYFHLVHFKGGKGGGSQTQTTTVNIPKQSENEKKLEDQLMGYNTADINYATGQQTNGVNSIGNTYNPNYGQLAGNYNTSMNNALNNYNTGMGSILNGQLPSAYAENRQKALNADLQATVGNTISGLANRGILNSSVTDNALNQISQNASNSLANSYASDLGQQAGLLNQNYTNQAANANSILTGNENAQQSSYFQPTSLLNYASQLANGGQNMYNNMFAARNKAAGSTTTQSGGGDGGAGVWGAVGSIGSAFAMCFAAGTMILTPEGEKPIEDIKPDNVVVTQNGTEIVACVNKPAFCPVVEIATDKGILKATDTQRLYTDVMKEPEYVMDIKESIVTKTSKAKIISRKYLSAQKVYDFTTTGSNSFYANGFLVEGFDETGDKYVR